MDLPESKIYIQSGEVLWEFQVSESFVAYQIRIKWSLSKWLWWAYRHIQVKDEVYICFKNSISWCSEIKALDAILGPWRDGVTSWPGSQGWNGICYRWVGRSLWDIPTKYIGFHQEGHWPSQSLKAEVWKTPFCSDLGTTQYNWEKMVKCCRKRRTWERWPRPDIFQNLKGFMGETKISFSGSGRKNGWVSHEWLIECEINRLSPVGKLRHEIADNRIAWINCRVFRDCRQIEWAKCQKAEGCHSGSLSVFSTNI